MYSFIGVFLWATLGCVLLKEVIARLLQTGGTADEQLEGAVLDLLAKVKTESNYGYVFAFDGVKSLDGYCVFHECLRSLKIPAIIMGSGQIPKIDTDIYPKDVVLVSCHYMNYNNDLFYNTDLQMAPHIIFAETEIDIPIICAQLERNEAYNAIVITRHFGHTKSYFVCELKFPLENYGKIRRRNLGEDGDVFEARFHNMRGHKIFTHPDQMLPRSFVYYDDGGNLLMDGYVGNILTTFARRLNGSLAYRLPIEPGVQTFFETLENGTREGLLDIATGVRPLNRGMYNISYPVEFMTFCYMIPLPLHIPVNEIFFMIVDLNTMLVILCLTVVYAILLTLASHNSTEYLTFVNVFCNDKSIRGLLGQSFIMPDNPRFLLKFICFLLCYTSVLLNTCYQAYLQSYLTEPPPHSLVRTYDDMRAAGLKIIASTRELNYLDPHIAQRYADVFDFQPNYTKYVEMRSTMDIRFVYSVTSAMWYVYQEKQKLFKQPSFYYSSHLCLKDSFLVAMPVRPGLPYRNLFNHHIMLLRDVGLMQHWTSNTFFTMLRLDLIDFKDLSSDTNLNMEIVLDDFFWIWVLYAACISVCFIVFFAEWFLYTFYYKK